MADPRLDRYFDLAGAVPLLTAAEEVELAKRVAAGRNAARRLSAGATDEDGRLAAKVDDGLHAFTAFVEANLRLVVRVAARAAVGSRVDFADLLQDGNVGLLRAVDRYDWRAGYRFSTFAMFSIRDAVQRGKASQERTVRLPYLMHDALIRIGAAEARLEAETGCHPTTEDLAAATRVPVARVIASMAYRRGELSLDQPLGGENPGDVLGAMFTTGEDPAEEAVEAVLTEEVRAHVAALDPRMREVLVRRLGLEGRDPEGVQRIAAEMHLHRNTVSALFRSAIEQLRANLDDVAA